MTARKKEREKGKNSGATAPLFVPSPPHNKNATVIPSGARNLHLLAG
ncbi:MAG: hypothetical protein HPY62_14260 [Bacteroidales bacterium]|nr:hypothetical protein [Bacteroidales bacterium]